MNLLKCPNCNSEMSKIKEPDITFERCENCGGIFLDKGELNVLATGMAGDIEFCSIDNDSHEDRFGIRYCPKCSNQKMRKINLLVYSDLIFDFCPKCEGFFLDNGEINAMNDELKKLNDSKFSEEFRGYIGNHLVRFDKTSETFVAYSLLNSTFRNMSFLRIAVYFNQSLDIGLNINSEKWTAKFLKFIHLYKKQDIQIGIEELDSIFIIQGKDTEKVKKLLNSEKLKKELIDFITDKPKMYTTTGNLKINDKQIIFTEGPYSKVGSYDVENDPGGIVERLIRLASLFEETINLITVE